MLLKLDENLPADACQMLVDAGHDAMSVLDQQLGGRPDDMIAEVCRAEARVLLTLDTDFANILVYPPALHAGLVVMRTEDQSKATVLELIRKVASVLATQSPVGQLWIIEPGRIRIRSSE